MRLAAMVGVGGFAATLGACAALSGLGDYEECPGTCDDAALPPRNDSSVDRDVKVPEETGAMTMDVGSPPEEVSTPVPDAEDENGDGQSADVSAPAEAGPDVVSPPPVDGGGDADAVASPPDAGLGSTCGPNKTTNRCSGSQVCCADLSTQVNTCTSSSCPSGATIGCAVPTDCPVSAPLCCASMTLNGGTLPKCSVSAFSSSCKPTCADNAPASGCTFTGTVRLCAHDKDCTSDNNGMMCYNFASAPESWCTTMAIGELGEGTHEP